MNIKFFNKIFKNIYKLYITLGFVNFYISIFNFGIKICDNDFINDDDDNDDCDLNEYNIRQKI